MGKFVCALLLMVVMPLAAQTPQPVYRIGFIPQQVGQTGPVQTGTFDIAVLPPPLAPAQQDSDEGVPVKLSVTGKVFSGSWLMDEPDQPEVLEEEAFVLAKFRLFQASDEVEEYRKLLDAETFESFSGSVANGEIDLEADRELYRQYDNIRLLGSLRYGAYTLLYTQFRSADSGATVTSVMPVRRVEGRLVTAGGLHANSHELYRMLAFGTLQRRLMEFMVSRAGR